MKKHTLIKKLFTLALISMLFGMFANATVHPIVNVGDTSVYTFLQNTAGYEDGDTIMLTTEGIYIESKSIDIFKSVTITTDPSLTSKPIINFHSGGFRFKAQGVDLILDGLKVSGIKPDNTQIKTEFITLNQTVDEDPIDTVKSIRILDCEIFGIRKGLRMGQFINTIIDTLIFDNVLWHDKDSLSSAAILNFGEKGTAKYMSITNSTFYSCGGAFMGSPLVFGKDAKPQVGTGKLVPKKFIIDHNTFYNILTNNGYFIAVHALNDGSLDLTLSNNIVSTIYDPANAVRPFRMNADAGPVKIINNCFYNFEPAADKLEYGFDSLVNYANVTLTGNVFVDPGFHDPSAGNFFITDSSQLTIAGTDGGLIGDPQWAPVPGVKILDINEKVIPERTVQMAATVNLGAGITDYSVTWSVVNGTGTASIGTDGMLTPGTVGNVKVFATSNHDNAKKDSLEVTIYPQVFVQELVIETIDAWWQETRDYISEPGGALAILVSVLPLEADVKTYTTTLSDDSKATLSDDFSQIIAKSNGEVYLIITADDDNTTKDSVKITISNQVGLIAVTKVTLTGSDITDGNPATIAAAIEPANATDKTLSWKVSDDKIASIDDKGVLTPISNGSVVVTATSVNGPSGKITINISGVATAISDASIASFSIFPNPASEMFYINSSQITEVTITNIIGKVELKTIVEANSAVNIQNLKPGLYLVHIKAGEQVSMVKLKKQ